MTPLTPNYGPTYRPLDRLDGDDLTDWQRVPLFASARHFRSLHRLYGMADGLNVTVVGDKVVVSPGVAFDRYGRPMVLAAEERISAKRELWIVLRGEEPVEQQLKVPVPAPQQCRVVVFKEKDATNELTPWDVPLARISDELKPDLSIRPVAVRTFRRPFVATGKVPSGTTAVALADGRGWQVWIDSYAAGFLPLQPDEPNTRAVIPEPPVPVYVVSVGRQTKDDAERLRTRQLALDGQDHFDRRPPLVTVSQASNKGFLLTVDYGDSVQDFSELSATPLNVWWTGIEQRTPGNRILDRAVDDSEGFVVEQKTLGRQLPWPEFRDEQRLTAFDLNSVQDTVRQLQWIHNRTLHDWGVAEGCEVTALPGRRGVLVQRGYAIDVDGREVILTDPVQLNVPAQKVTNGPITRKTWWVTASYRGAPAPRNDDRCRQQGVPLRRLPEAAVRWRDPEQNDKESRLEPGYDIILATVELERGDVVSVTPIGRRSAVPSKRPYISAGRSSVDNKNALKFDRKSRVLTVTLTIETSQASFVSAPHYLIQVETRKVSEFPRSIAQKDSKSFEQRWKTLVKTLGDSHLEFVAVDKAKAAGLELIARLRLPSSSSGIELIEQLVSGDEQKSNEQHSSHELQLLKENFLTALPYQFAWFGIEV